MSTTNNSYTRNHTVPRIQRQEDYNPNWILLDSQSTINIFNNRKIFKHIRQCTPAETVRCYCNGDYQDTNQVGEVDGIGTVYYNQKLLANIVSLSHIDNKYIG